MLESVQAGYLFLHSNFELKITVEMQKVKFAVIILEIEPFSNAYINNRWNGNQSRLPHFRSKGQI